MWAAKGDLTSAGEGPSPSQCASPRLSFGLPEILPLPLEAPCEISAVVAYAMPYKYEREVGPRDLRTLDDSPIKTVDHMARGVERELWFSFLIWTEKQCTRIFNEKTADSRQPALMR